MAMLAQPPTARHDIISAILNDYAAPRDDGWTAFPPVTPAKDTLAASAKVNKPLPSVGGGRYQLRVGHAGTRSAGPDESADAELDSPKIVSRFMVRSGKPASLTLSESNGATATSPPVGSSTSGSMKEAGTTTTTTTTRSAAPARGRSVSPPSSNARERPLPTLPANNNNNIPPPPPKTDMRKIMGGSQSKGLPSNPRDVANRSPFDNLKSKFTGRRKPVGAASAERQSDASAASRTSSSTSSVTSSKPLPPVQNAAEPSIASSTQPSTVMPSIHSRETSTTTGATAVDNDRSTNGSAPAHAKSASEGVSGANGANIRQALLPSPSPVLEESPSKYGVKRKPSRPVVDNNEKPGPVMGLPSNPKGLPSNPKNHMRGRSSAALNTFKTQQIPHPNSHKNHNNNSYASNLSPPDSAGSPDAATSGPFALAHQQFTHPSIANPPATPDSETAGSEARSTTSSSLLMAQHLPPQRLSWIYLARRPAATNAPPLTTMHTRCFTRHARLVPQSNRIHPVACMLCFVDAGERVHCTHCCLRVCRGCADRLRAVKGRDVAKVVDLSRARTVGGEMNEGV